MMERNCPKHVEFYSKNKFEKLVHLVGVSIRIYHDARSSERQICLYWTTQSVSLTEQLNVSTLVIHLYNIVH